MITENDLKALGEFLEKYPTWWYTIGVCDRSRDFTCAPQGHSPEISLIDENDPYDCPFNSGFMCDHHGTLEDAIREVMDEIEKAKKKGQK